MAKPRKPRQKKKPEGGPYPQHAAESEAWLAQQPREWSIVIAARATLRILPLISDFGPKKGRTTILQGFRGAALCRFVGKYPHREEAAMAAARFLEQNEIDTVGAAIGFAAFAASSSDDFAYAAARAAYEADVAVGTNINAQAMLHTAIKYEAQQLQDDIMTPEQLTAAPLWPVPWPSLIENAWHRWHRKLHEAGNHWEVWINWYEGVLAGVPYNEACDAAFTELPGPLRWASGAKAVNTEIARRLEALRPDPVPVDGVPSPVAINIRPDGRIGADAGLFGVPTVPPSRTLQDHARALSACRNLAERLKKTASSPEFNGRREYAETLAAYLDWLPADSNSGNILLADSEARVLTKLFTADEGILAEGFASRLSVFLENHIAARAFYPEVALHYQSIRTGHIATPLPHDAVDGFRETVRAHSPEVFDETVPRVMEETAKPVPEASPPAPADAPPPVASRPKPPKDPIADADPATSRSTIFARTANRIWQVLRDGKDLPQAIDGWGKAYDQLKPYIGPIIAWLKTNMPGGPGGTPPASPTIGV